MKNIQIGNCTIICHESLMLVTNKMIYDEADMHYLKTNPKSINKGQSVKVLDVFTNAYGTYIRCDYKGMIYDIRPENLDYFSEDANSLKISELEREERFKYLINEDFLHNLVEIGKLYGWSGDYVEISSFIEEMHNKLGVDVPDLTPYEYYEYDGFEAKLEVKRKNLQEQQKDARKIEFDDDF